MMRTSRGRRAWAILAIAAGLASCSAERSPARSSGLPTPGSTSSRPAVEAASATTASTPTVVTTTTAARPAAETAVSSVAVAPPPPIVYRPARVDLSQPELVNAFRGSYEWNEHRPMPDGWPVLDSYARLTWRALEPSRDHYDFGVIDRELAAARARGGKFGFRIMPACTGCSDPSIAVPDYLRDLMPRGFWFEMNGTSNYAPDWNDPDYLDRLNRLLHALGDRYRGDPRLGWVEISGYGDWGEWHTFQWPYPSSTGATDISPENANAVVDMNLDAFRGVRLVMLHDNEGALNHALSRSSTVGIRNDCLGLPWFTDGMRKHSAFVLDRWKTAPVVVEYCQLRPGDGGLALASNQIREFHVAMIGNGNLEPWAAFSSDEQRTFAQNNKLAGYRIAVDHVTAPGVMVRGVPVVVESGWVNDGVTPPYNPWRVVFELSTAKGNVVWRGGSRLDLQRLLPTGARPTLVTDGFTIPSSVRPGNYQLVVRVEDPAGYYAPMALATQGRDGTGAYRIGPVTIG